MKKGLIIAFIIMGGIFCLSFLMCLGWGLSADESTPEQQELGESLDKILTPDESVKKENKEIEYITVSAEDLINEYEANELKADEKYLNKYLIVKGYVSNISKVLGSTSVTIGTGEDFEVTAISCSFSKENEDQVIELEKGQEIIIHGKCNGKGWDIELKGCEIK